MGATFSEARLARIGPRMEAHVASGAYAGIGWRIGTAEGVVHEGRVGAAREDTLWRIYSMTKPIVSIAAMQLVEECRIPLHARIRRWLPEFETPAVLEPSGARVPAREPIALIHLLSHMAGLSYGFLSDPVVRLYAEFGILADDSEPLREVVRRIGAMPLANHPGERWRYSVATDVLGALLEEEEGRSLPEILRRRIFEPLGMADAGFFVPEGSRDRVAEVRGTSLPPSLPAVPPLGVDAIHPADRADFARGGLGLFATVDDYARFAEALLRVAQGDMDGPVSPRTLAAMTTSQLSESQLPMITSLPFDSEAPGFGGFGFGLGFAIDEGARARRLLGAPGCFWWAGAADTWFTVDPGAGCYAVFMSQSTDRAGASYDFQTLFHAAASWRGSAEQVL